MPKLFGYYGICLFWTSYLVDVYVLKILGAICGYALLHQNVMVVVVLACQFEGQIEPAAPHPVQHLTGWLPRLWINVNYS
jgi:hypothetical protein